MANRCAGYIAITFMDEERQEFVELGGAGFATKERLREAWNDIPRAPRWSPFTADFYSADGYSIVADREIDIYTCERLLKAPIGDLIKIGRERS